MDTNPLQLLPIGLDAIDDLPNITPPSILKNLIVGERKTDTTMPKNENPTTNRDWQRPRENNQSNGTPPTTRPMENGATTPTKPSEPGRLPADSINPALLSLAMGFVPFQAWETPYESDVALQRGTIFPSLDKPFIGEEAVPR